MTGKQAQRSIPRQNADVAIVGGGLAGLTLALQLKQASADADIVVLERRKHPVPAAAHKVGESTVEIGAQYLAGTLGQRQYLDRHQLPKFGLRYFFGNSGGDLALADELGTSRLLSVPSFQLDRGLLENHLAEEAQRLGVRFGDGTRVSGVDVSDAGHRVTCRTADGPLQLKTRWLIDTASRASPLKRHLGLAADNDHACYAIWFRVAERIAVDDWSTCAQWQQRCGDRMRWLSTNHMMGPGYWVWLIPLASGATSIGIVADPALHPLAELRSFPGALNWLERHQPRCAEAVRGCELLDFHYLKRYSHDCRQVFSDQRWGLSGESGVFLDPYYSPGTDFIAISNCLLADLVLRERRGEDIRVRCRTYQQLYFSFYRNTLQLVFQQYAGFGDRHLMTLKTVWDFSYYWGILGCLFFNGALTDLDFMAQAQNDLLEVQKTNRRLQNRFRERAARAIRLPGEGRFIDQAAIPVLVRLNGELTESLDRSMLLIRIRDNVHLLSDLAQLLQSLLIDGAEGSADMRESELLGDLRRRLA